MDKKIFKNQDIINVDLDGTLSIDICWTSKECLNARPNKKFIKIVNKLYEEKFIIIYTARRDFMIEASLKWLRNNGIRFHAISNNKIPGFYIDDNCINYKQLK